MECHTFLQNIIVNAFTLDYSFRDTLIVSRKIIVVVKTLTDILH